MPVTRSTVKAQVRDDASDLGLVCWAVRLDRQTINRPLASGPGCSALDAIGRAGDAVDLPDLPAEGDNVRGGPDELQRGRPVETVGDDGEGAVPVDLHQGAGIRQRGRTRRAAGPNALGEGVQRAAAAKLHVNEQRTARGHLRHRGGRLRPERHHLAVFGQVRDGAGLGHVNGVAPYREPGRDDIAEGDQLGDLAVKRDPVHAVVVAIGDQEPATIRLERVLNSAWDVERSVRRVVDGELADVRDHGEAHSRRRPGRRA